MNQTPDVKELGLTSRYRLVLGNLCMILFPRMQFKSKEPIEPQPVYSWFYADIRRYSFSKQMREFAIYCGRSCPTPEKIICFRVKSDLVQLLQVVNEKTGGAFQAELANMKVKKRVCAVSWQLRNTHRLRVNLFCACACACACFICLISYFFGLFSLCLIHLFSQIFVLRQLLDFNLLLQGSFSCTQQNGCEEP